MKSLRDDVLTDEVENFVFDLIKSTNRKATSSLLATISSAIADLFHTHVDLIAFAEGKCFIPTQSFPWVSGINRSKHGLRL